MPRMHSTPPFSCFATSTPSMRAARRGGLRARSSSSAKPARTASASADIQQHAADFRFVQDVGRQDLHHHREAEPFRRGDGLLGRCAGGLRRRRQSRPPPAAASPRPRTASRPAASTAPVGGAGRRQRRGERRPEAAHRVDRDHRAGRILVHHPAIGLQLVPPVRRHDDRQHVEPVRIFRRAPGSVARGSPASGATTRSC